MFCRKYHCKAENPHGVAFHDIELEEAHEPGELQQAILDKSTATTLQFRYLATSTTVQVPSHQHYRSGTQPLALQFRYLASSHHTTVQVPSHQHYSSGTQPLALQFRYQATPALQFRYIATTLQFRYLATSTTVQVPSQSHHTFVSVYPLQLYLTQTMAYV